MSHSHDESDDVRTSLYLVRRAEALLGALKLFLNEAGAIRSAGGWCFSPR